MRKLSSFLADRSPKNAPTIQFVLEDAVGSVKSVKVMGYGLRISLAYYLLNKTAQANRKKDFHSNLPLKNLWSGLIFV